VCTLAAYVGCWPELPLVVAANRDEFLDRPSADPGVIAVDPWVFAGQDLSAGGTWLGVNETGLVVGLLNRRTAGGPDATRRSRGLLCLTMLQQRSRAAARAALTAERGGDYNRFNLLIADRDGALVASNANNHITVQELPPGMHLLTNLELNDPTCPRIAKSWQHFAAIRELDPAGDAAALVAPLRTVLADHSTALDPRAATFDMICVHLPGYGTRSSSIVAADAHGRLRLWHAAGPPCTTELRELALPA
jgi:uncharacterized protein with NRDE domain